MFVVHSSRIMHYNAETLQRSPKNLRMPYIQRHPDGHIIALQLSPAEPAQEYLPSTHPDVLAFLETADPNGTASDLLAPIQALAGSDRDIARVTEDLIQLLVAKNIILFTELPVPVQKKLLTREKLRSSLQDDYSNLLDDSDTL